MRSEDYPTRIVATLKDGRMVERLVRFPAGSPKNPMSAAQLRDKFYDCAAHAASIGRSGQDRSDARPAG